MAEDDTTPLGAKIRRLIEATGPISVADYFALCLSDPDHGYYMTREPFGMQGDFTTAPEITQLFGELIGIFLVQCWDAQGRPEHVRLVELGPGRGTLMADMLRTIASLAPALLAASTVHMVDTSDRLAAIQKETLSAYGAKVARHRTLEKVPAGHTFFVANEFFDALPLRQFVRYADGYAERMVGVGPDGGLVFVLGPATVDPSLLPADAAKQAQGTICEIAPMRTAFAAAIARRLVTDGGAALIVDYGHMVSGYGDTLQALRRQEFDPPLAHPGEADLTSHVDFEALAKSARDAGASIAGLSHQGDFLIGLGLLERAGRLGAGKTPREQAAIQAAAERIAAAGPGRMGELFKVLALTGKTVKLAPFQGP